LPVIEGGLPDLVDLPGGCIFKERCSQRMARCDSERPRLSGGRHPSACHLQDPTG
jgi:oligopeptide/dipeptide ABC transporter ATP-binding protein